MKLLDSMRQRQAATGVALLALALVIVNSVLVLNNENRQAEVNQRQQFINQSIQLSRVSQGLVSALAQAAVKNDDKDIREMLASSGFTIHQTGPTSQKNGHPPASGTPAQPAGK